MHRYYHPEVGVPDVFAPAGPPILDHYPYAVVPIIQFISIRSLKNQSKYLYNPRKVTKAYEKRGEKKETLKDPAEHTTYQRYDPIYDDIHLTLRTFCDLRKLF